MSQVADGRDIFVSQIFLYHLGTLAVFLANARPGVNQIRKPKRLFHVPRYRDAGGYGIPGGCSVSQTSHVSQGEKHGSLPYGGVLRRSTGHLCPSSQTHATINVLRRFLRPFLRRFTQIFTILRLTA